MVRCLAVLGGERPFHVCTVIAHKWHNKQEKGHLYIIRKNGIQKN
jgi:hypothetical protein